MAIHKTALEARIKNKIKQLLDEKKIKITRFSEDIGYSRGFISSILGKPKKFFNLEQIEKICFALDYPVARLFADAELEDLSRDMSLAEPSGPTYGSDGWEKAQAIPELQELINILLALPADKQKQLLDSLLSVARLTAHTERL